MTAPNEAGLHLCSSNCITTRTIRRQISNKQPTSQPSTWTDGHLGPRNQFRITDDRTTVTPLNYAGLRGAHLAQLKIHI